MTQTGEGRRYGGLDADQRRAERRRRLVGAALDLYGTLGYGPTTIADVCRRAGVAPSHFYEVFGSREELLRALYDEIVATTRAAVLEAIAVAPALDSASLARAGLGAFCRDLMGDPRRARVQCLEVVGVSAEMEVHRRSVIDSYCDLLTAQLAALRREQGMEMPADPVTIHVLATAVVGGVNEAMIDWLLAQERPDVDSVVAALAILFDGVASALL